MSHLNTEELEKLIWDSVEDIENRREVVVPTRKVTYYWVLKDLIDQALHQQREQIKERMEKTFDGCACGYHGYLVLPDCDENDHNPEECARCILNSLSSPKEGEHEND